MIFMFQTFVGHIPETVWIITDSSEGKFATAESAHKFSSPSKP